MLNEGGHECNKDVQNAGGMVEARISQVFLFLYVSALEGSGYVGQRNSLRLSSSFLHQLAVSLNIRLCFSAKPNR